MEKRPLHLLLYICLFFSSMGFTAPAPVPRAEDNYDVVIYGATPAGIAAAIQTVRMKKTVVIVHPTSHIGGLTTSGLGWTDSKNGSQIGGIAREFYHKIWNYYRSDSAWVQESRASYVAKHIGAQPGQAIEDGKQVQWTFEPHVAEKIFDDWMRAGRIPIFRNEQIIRSGLGVTKDDDNRIVSIRTQSGKRFTGSMFIDAGYEGDLMATAGIPYRIGREGRDEFDESWAGVQINNNREYHGIDPYVKEGDSSSGLIKGIQRTIRHARGLNGTADPHRLQSYNYRISLTKNPNIKVPFEKPSGYDEAAYELLFRYIESGYRGPFFTQQLMPNQKTDTNANGKVSTDLMGGNYDDNSNFAEDGYSEREKTADKHRTYAQGFFWTLANHDRVPQFIRQNITQWGYAKDEWEDNGNWPYEIYIREGRRMQGVYTITQGDTTQSRSYPDDSVIGLGCYNLDVHQVERVVIDHEIYDEGLVHVPNYRPYAIPFGGIIPESSAATNFLNPVTMSSTHVALSSLRMEPTYMILGQSAATAAVLAIEQGVNIQDVDRNKLTERLRADAQMLA